VAAHLTVDSSMILKNSFASDFITNPTTIFFSDGAAEAVVAAGAGAAVGAAAGAQAASTNDKIKVKIKILKTTFILPSRIV
jgi:microcystin degradation protein MlrC